MTRASKLSRRAWLRRTGVTLGSALGLPSLVSARALGLAGAPPASERVTVGKIGCGGRGTAIGGVGGQVVAVCDAWKDRRERWAQRAGCQAYADFRDLLARDDIDAVCVASPDHWHVHHTVAAAKAGKHVYCEKPLGVSFLEDQICRETIRRYDRVFQYGTQQRSMPHCRFGCELVRSGKIGEVKEIVVYAPDSHPGNTTAPQPVPEGLDYEMWLGPAPWQPYCGQARGGEAWWHDYDYALGFIAGWGAHPLDILVWGYDVRRAGNWEIEGTAHIPYEGRNDVIMHWEIHVRFGNGVKMTILPGSDLTKFIGTEGWVGIRRRGLEAEPASLLKTQLGPDDVHLMESTNHGANFAQAVKEHHDPVSNIDDAVLSDAFSHLSDIAVRTGRKIVWDPIREQIIGDEEAARRLTRAWREPWSLRSYLPK